MMLFSKLVLHFNSVFNNIIFVYFRIQLEPSIEFNNHVSLIFSNLWQFVFLFLFTHGSETLENAAAKV